ncbi:hypothetical protein BSKO_08633 [Bryopsis sp. KO-2023]|nr:hypothetical protein BSKO_08633 [Bryopsis sp. KO-2023]
MSGVANKEEALRCLSIAEKALQAKDLEKAERFAQKAKKLCECDEVRLFLRKLSPRKAAAGPSTSTGTTTSAAAAERLRQRNAPQSSSDSSRPKATKEQIELVQRIRKSKDFYDILAISKESSDDDIKRAYKKLALKLHPDKNSAPGAEEAFKGVSRAFSCLSDPEKRANYDRYGFEDRAQAAAAQGPQYYADEIDPQEIFNMFFGGGFPMHGNGRVYRTHFGNARRRQYHPQEQNRDTHRNQTPGGIGGLLQFIPVLFLLAFTFLGSPEPGAPYSLNQDRVYRQDIRTRRYGIVFFVKDKTQFNRDYPVRSYQRGKIESEVESTVKRYLQVQCNEERRKHSRVEYWKGKEEAESLELPNCKTLHDTFSRKPSQQEQVLVR